MKNDKELKQAKKRTEKIYITDIAIEKVPYIRYKNFSEKQNFRGIKSGNYSLFV